MVSLRSEPQPLASLSMPVSALLLDADLKVDIIGLATKVREVFTASGVGPFEGLPLSEGPFRIYQATGMYTQKVNVKLERQRIS